MMQLTEKLPNIPVTIFTVMSQFAQQHKAINLGQGFPDFVMDEALIALVNKAMQDGNNQYTHTNGLPLLRELLAEKYTSLYGCALHADKHITVTPGATYAIYNAVTTLLHPGDEAIVFEPAYDSYIPNIIANGAKAIPIPLTFPDYSVSWEALAKAITPKTKLIIVNTPHNPTGKVWTKEDWQKLYSLIKDTSIWVISDEVYEHLIFDNLAHESLLKQPYLWDRSLVCFSFGKTYHCTGWKLGYVIATEHLTHAFRKLHQYNAFCCDTPKQVALAQYLQTNKDYLDLGKLLQGKRDFLRQQLAATGLIPLQSHGSYFECYDYSGLSDLTDRQFAEKLTIEAGVATIPVSAFYSEANTQKVIRFCFTKKQETLEAAAYRLKNYFGV
ncbi:MAG: methionine aminotransferase [Chitinophagaceae bacterium]